MHSVCFISWILNSMSLLSLMLWKTRLDSLCLVDLLIDEESAVAFSSVRIVDLISSGEGFQWSDGESSSRILISPWRLTRSTVIEHIGHWNWEGGRSKAESKVKWMDGGQAWDGNGEETWRRCRERQETQRKMTRSRCEWMWKNSCCWSPIPMNRVDLLCGSELRMGEVTKSIRFVSTDH